MKILFALSFLVLLTGCSSINTVDKETYQSLETGIQILNKDFLEYVKNDKNISERTKLSINTKIKNSTDAFKSLKIKE